MSTITVANRSDLLSALSAARGGETIVLEDGHYGALKITADYASPVTVRSESRLDATISKLELFGASNLRFDGIEFDSGINGARGGRIVSIERGSQNIQIVNSEITGKDDNVYDGHWGIYVRNSNDVTLHNNSIHDVNVGVVAFGSKGLDVINNKIDYFAADAMKLGSVHSANIVDNVSYGKVFPPAGTHNDFIQFQGNSSNVNVDGNVFLASTVGSVQGIFFNDGTYSNISVENNIIYTGMIQGVWFQSASSGVNISNNTLLNIPGENHGQTKIKAPGGSSVNNNIISDFKGGATGSNLAVQNSKPGDAYYVDNFYKNGAEGRGVTVQDLIPVIGSLAQSKGAAGRLKELLGGVTAPAPDPSSPPAPEPEPELAPESAPPAGSDGALAINAGGGASGAFAADSFLFGGRTFKTGAGIAKTGADAIYQTERFGDFRYAAPVEDGTYDVTLRFAEIYHGAAGKRLFDVRAEDRLVLDNFDVFKAAGGKNVAVDRSFRVEVDDGRLDLAFDSVRDYAKISGIEIDPL